MRILSAGARVELQEGTRDGNEDGKANRGCKAKTNLLGKFTELHGMFFLAASDVSASEPVCACESEARVARAAHHLRTRMTHPAHKVRCGGSLYSYCKSASNM